MYSSHLFHWVDTSTLIFLWLLSWLFSCGSSLYTLTPWLAVIFNRQLTFLGTDTFNNDEWVKSTTFLHHSYSGLLFHILLMITRSYLSKNNPLGLTCSLNWTGKNQPFMSAFDTDVIAFCIFFNYIHINILAIKSLQTLRFHVLDCSP